MYKSPTGVVLKYRSQVKRNGRVFSLGEKSNVCSCGLCVCGGPFVLLYGKWQIPTKLFVPQAVTLNLPSPPPADDLKRGNAYFYFGSWFEKLTLLSIILFPCP